LADRDWLIVPSWGAARAAGTERGCASAAARTRLRAAYAASHAARGEG
jgi:hypothetical protein